MERFSLAALLAIVLALGAVALINLENSYELEDRV